MGDINLYDCLKVKSEEFKNLGLNNEAEQFRMAWNVIIETDDTENRYPIEISMEDSEYIYNMENMDKETAIFFEEIKTQGSLIKVSKDGFIEGRIGLAEYNGNWYWRTETIDESRERDYDWPEYIIPLPDALSGDINEIIGN